MRFYTALASVLVLLSFVFVSPTAAQTTCDTTQGLAALQAGNYSEAITIYSCVIEADPLNTDAYLGRGQAELLSGAWYDGYSDLVAADQFGSGDGSSFRTNYDQAIMWIVEHPDQTAGYILRAWQNWYWALDSLAFDDYERILDIEPDNLFALTFSASSSFFTDAPDWEDSFNSVIELAPDNPHVLTMFGGAYRYIGQSDQAFIYLNRAPDFAPAVYMHGEVNFDLHRYPSAQRDYQHVLELNPAPEYAVRAYIGLGQVDLELDQPADAADAFAQADAIYPHSADVAQRIAMTYDGRDDDLAAYWYYQFVVRSEERSETGDPLLVGEVDYATIAPGMALRLPITLAAGDSLVIRVASISAESVRVDPLIVLLAPDGTPLRGNDDLERNVSLVSGFDFTVPADGDYTLVITSTYYGNSGQVEISVNETN